MQEYKDPHLIRLHELLEVADELEATCLRYTGKYMGNIGPIAIVNQAMFDQWINNSLDAILLAFGKVGKDHSYYISFKKHHSDFLNKSASRPVLLRSCRPILSAAAEAYAGEQQNVDHEESTESDMRYNQKLYELLLIQAEGEENPSLSAYTKEQVLEHKILLIDDGLAKGSALHGDDVAKAVMITKLTSKGHRKLRDIRNQRITKAKMSAASTAEANISKVSELITDHFNLEEFRGLCLKVDVNPDEFGDKGISAISNALVLYMQRRGRIDELIAVIIKERPHIESPLNS